jgi:hypothetical protein
VTNDMQVQHRVDAWIAERLRRGWFNGHPYRHQLLGQWRLVLQHFDADTPAPLGVVLALAREAWGRPGMHAELDGRIWLIRDPEGRLISGPRGSAMFNEHEAFLAALEASP